MDTIEQTNTLTDSVTVQGLTLLELLDGASTHADKGKSALTALNSVQIEGEGELVARATDRFRLIEGKVEGEGTLSPSLIALDDVKRVIDLVKGNKAARVSLNRIGDLLTVSAGGSSLTLNLMSANYPATFNDLLNKSERECLGEISFNPAYFADYAKIAGKGNAVRVEFTGDRKPIIVHLPANKVTWRALLMPMRVI
jgi:DNA polymerase III sliding clamp (beta) subunit (PCNA family)